MPEPLDLRKVFRDLSTRMRNELSDFRNIVPNKADVGSKAEDVFRKWLVGYLPGSAAVTSGYVVNPAGQWSHQCDAIIYQPDFAPKLFADDHLQILPIECVYGIIEVSSSINKEKLRQDFKKIRRLKSLVRRGRTRYKTGIRNFEFSGERNIPFGLIFSFSLRACTLEDLSAEFEILCENSEPFTYPNQVTVNEVGQILFLSQETARSGILTHSNHIAAIPCQPLPVENGNLALLGLYFATITLVTNSMLVVPDLYEYLNVPHTIGDFKVQSYIWDADSKKKVLPKQESLEQIVAYCRSAQKISLKQMVIESLGTELDLDEGLETSLVFFFNPKSLRAGPESGGPLGQLIITVDRGEDESYEVWTMPGNLEFVLEEY